MWLLLLLLLLLLVPWDELSFVSDRCERSLVTFACTETRVHNPRWSLVNIPYLILVLICVWEVGCIHFIRIVISSLHTSIFNQLASARIYEYTERERTIWVDVILIRVVAAGRSFFLSFSPVFFCASTYTRSYTLYCARWFSSKRKKRRQTRTHVKQKTRDRERANDVSWTFAHTYVLQKKAFASLFIRLSFFLMFASFFFGTFLPSFSRSLVLLLVVVVLIVIRRY